MKKVLRYALLIVSCIIVFGGLVAAVWLSILRHQASQYNFIDVEKAELPAAAEPVEESFVQLPDVNMHYVKYGSGGHDVVLIHGNGGSAYSLASVASLLASDYTVFCVSDRCQGKSSDPGVISYELMAKDVRDFILAKGLNKPYVMGHSDGGMVAIALAAEYPDSVGSIVSFGANSHPKKLNLTFRTGVWFNNLFHKNKLNDLMLTQPDFNPTYLSRIVAPAYIVSAEYDILPASDTYYLHEHIAGSEYAVVKNADHSDYVGDGRGYALTVGFFRKVAASGQAGTDLS